LTSYPPRFSILKEALENFSKQVLQPDILVLNIAKSHEFVLPSEIKNLKLPFRFEINYTSDLGPGKKLIPTMHRYPNSSIITVDDDLRYSETLCLDLVGESKKNPNAIICGRVNLPLFDDRHPKAYNKWLHGCEWTPDFLYCAGTGGGTLFPPGSLNRDVLDEDLYSRLSWSTDDIWVWIQMLRSHTQLRSIPIFYSENPENGVGLTSQGNHFILNNYNLEKLWKFYKMEEVVTSYVEKYKIVLSQGHQKFDMLECDRSGNYFKRDELWRNEDVREVLELLPPRGQLRFTKVLVELAGVIDSQLREQKKLKVTLVLTLKNLVRKFRNTSD